MRPTGKVRPATVADMVIIEGWLPKDRSIGTLKPNWNLTMQAFSEGGVSVREDEASRKPVAYCWGSLNSHSSILEVQPEFRGRGVGRSMVDFMVESSVASGEPLLEIQSAPESSEPFWQAMGFNTYWDRNYCYGRRMLKFRRAVPAGLRRQVSVTFLPGPAVWAQDVKPLAVHQLEGIDVPSEGKVVFDTTIAHFDLPHGDDLVVEVVVSGERRYRGKAKYASAAAIGIQPCRNGFMIAEVLRGDAVSRPSEEENP